MSRIRSIALGGAEVFVCLFESILYAEEILTSRVLPVTDTRDEFAGASAIFN